MQERPLPFLGDEVYPWEVGAVASGEKTWEGSEAQKCAELVHKNVGAGGDQQ